MAVVFLSGNNITATSGDVKPTLVATNSVLLETDTNLTYQYNGSSWVRVDEGVGDSVTNAELAGSISLDKLANGTAGKIVGFNASTGVPEEQDAPSGEGAGSVLLPHDSTIGNYTQSLDSISASSAYPIIQSGFTNIDPRTGDWNLRSVQINGNVEALNSTWKVTEERNLRDDGSSVYLTDVTYKYSRYGAYPNPQGTWRIELQQADGTVVDTFNVNAYTGGSWSQGNTTTRSNINAVASKFVVYGKRDGSGQVIIDFQSQFTSYQAYDFTGSFVEPMSNVIDDNTSTFMKTNAEVNPNMTLDLGSGNDAIITQVALYPHSDFDETEIQIQTSSDNSTWTTKRTITVSGNITTGSWNLIRINSTRCRYVRVRGSSGSSKTLSFYELKLKSASSDEVSANHAHSEISSTDTSLGLDGT